MKNVEKESAKAVMVLLERTPKPSEDEVLAAIVAGRNRAWDHNGAIIPTDTRSDAKPEPE